MKVQQGTYSGVVKAKKEDECNKLVMNAILKWHCCRRMR
jgi:hypothetical protein